MAQPNETNVLITVKILTLIVLSVFFFREFLDAAPLTYFAFRPSRILLVFFIAIAGGSIMWLYSKLSASTQRRFQLIGMGLPAIFLTGFALWLGGNMTGMCHLMGIGVQPSYFLGPVKFLTIGAVVWTFFLRAILSAKRETGMKMD